MKKLIIFVIFIGFISTLQAQEKQLLKKWSYNTAYLMPEGKWESGLFQPFRYGINNELEVYSNVLMLPLIPGVGAKISILNSNGYAISSDHNLSVPTPFLNIISRKGIGGFISPEYDFSFIMSVNNSLIVSKPITPFILASVNAGFTFAVRGKKPDIQSTIDIPLFYPRMAHYYEGTSVRLGGALKGNIGTKLFFEESVKAFYITRSENNLFLENSGTIMWAFGRSLRIRGGYIVAYGRYPYITPIWQMWPTLDLVFGSR